MRSDLDRLLEEAGIDGLWITGGMSANAAARYFIGGAHLTVIDIIKPAGRKAALYHGPMEREEAAATGLEVRTRSSDDWARFLAEANDDLHLARAKRLAEEFRLEGLSAGRVAVYGKVEPGDFLSLLEALSEELPGVEFLPTERSTDVMVKARKTKSPDELSEIEWVGRRTIEVVQLVQDFLTGRPVQDGHLLNEAGDTLTVGEVKRMVRLWLAERELEAPHGIILAPGEQAGYPHSEGRHDSPIPVGESIIFDIYPREVAGGYFFDFTRTWCLGDAAENVRQAHLSVLSVFDEMLERLVVGADTREVQLQADRAFENAGHPSRLNTPGTTDGFFHGLGHGLGLDIHEAPWFDEYRARTSQLGANMVVTLEPGLYYPQRGFGVRVEDTVVIEPDGGARILAPYPTDLILPMQNEPAKRSSG